MITNLTLVPPNSVATAVLEALNNIVIVVDSKGRVEYVSDAVVDVLGYTPSELLNEGWWRITHDSERERSHMRSYASALAQGAIPPRELPYERAIKTLDGSTRWIL